MRRDLLASARAGVVTIKHRHYAHRHRKKYATHERRGEKNSNKRQVSAPRYKRGTHANDANTQIYVGLTGRDKGRVIWRGQWRLHSRHPE